MATSGTNTWTLNIDEIIEDAYEKAGWEGRTGYDLATARRSLNLVLTEWTNNGINLWKISQPTVASLTAGQQTLALTNPVVDILDAVMRDSSTGLDMPMSRISMEEYLSRPDKSIQQPMFQYAIFRTRTGPTIYFYPVPNDATRQFVYYSINHCEDVGAFNQEADVPKRFLPALVYGLACELWLKKPVNALEAEAAKASAQKYVILRDRADALFAKAAEEDRDRTSVYWQPQWRFR